MPGDGCRAARNGFYFEHGLRGVVQPNGVFGRFDSGLQEGLVQVREDVDGAGVLVVMLI